MSRCIAKVRTQMNRAEHRCMFPAKANGYCTRHDPAKCIATLERQIRRLKEQLAEKEKQLVATYEI